MIGNQPLAARRTSRRRRGYTLLETMLAVALAAILMGLIASGLRLYTRIVSDKRSEITNTQVAHAVMQQLRRDIRGAYFEETDDSASLDPEEAAGGADGLAGLAGAADTSGIGDEDMSALASEIAGGDETADDMSGSTGWSIPGIYGTAGDIRIDSRGKFSHPVRYDAIVDAGGDPMLSNLVSFDRVVSYSLRSMDANELQGTPLELAVSSSGQTTVLVRSVQNRAESELNSAIGGATTALGNEQLLSDRVVGLSFQYHDGSGWVETWDAEEMAGLPIAIKITLTLADPENEDAVIGTDNMFETTIALPTAVIPEAEVDTEAGF